MKAEMLGKPNDEIVGKLVHNRAKRMRLLPSREV